MLEHYFILSVLIQLTHSLEELLTKFHARWYLFTMPFWVFLLFEICFSLMWVSVWIFPLFPYRILLQNLFLILMLANGVQHIVWAGVKKTYVPGLITAPLHVITVLFYYFSYYTAR